MKHVRSPYGAVMVSEGRPVDVYAVGVLLRLGTARRLALHGRWSDAWAQIRHERRFVAGWVRRRQWRAAKNAFNGYLAEPLWDYDEPGARWDRCGTGWTRKRAIRDLARHLRAVNR